MATGATDPTSLTDTTSKTTEIKQHKTIIINNLKYIKILLPVVLFFSFTGVRAQITIGQDQKAEDGAILQLKEKTQTDVNSTRGLLMPRVSLLRKTNDNMSQTMENADNWDKAVHTGLCVYNTNTVVAEDICPGLYFWDGTKWCRMHEPCTGNTPSTNLIFDPNYNVDAGSTTLYVNTAGSFTQGTTDEYTRGSGVAHSEMAAGVFKYTRAEGEAFAGYTYDHASGITVTIDAATLATGAGELPVKVSGTVDAAYAGKAFDIPITVLGQQLYVRVSVGCGAYTTTMADRTIVKGSPQLTGDPDWLQFQCFNLGADATKDPFQRIVGDEKGENGTLGWSFQWGRNADGHQLRNSETTPSSSNNINPGHDKYIQKSGGDWLDDAVVDRLRWGDGSNDKDQPKGPTDPCSTGWKVPSRKQLISIIDTDDEGVEGVNNDLEYATGSGGTKIGNALYLPNPGRRSSLAQTGDYWSTTPDYDVIKVVTFQDGGFYSNDKYPAGDGTVRCVKCADGETCN
ncbi:hypothetical protein D0T84_21185 [Dysgonomonas sp. 521]|uniref:DUF1566 domain-containing protein n=1 Tax=Dysgonomonas sp. 521 TaxID=2302932 RepID=UPI0013D8BA21|nr:DUF1566 domain-containing protein [Dysgonomonas sp. 521]NDV97391.1 hypothetical protein [Dysgonomonas sp. 521]